MRNIVIYTFIGALLMMGLFYYFYEFNPNRLREGKIVETIVIEENQSRGLKNSLPKKDTLSKGESAFQLDLRELSLLEQRVIRKGKECKQRQSRIFKDFEFVDPNGKFYKDKQEAGRLAFYYLGTIDRKESYVAFSKYLEVLAKDYPIDPISFKSRLKLYEVCIDSQMLSFVDAFLEAFKLMGDNLKGGEKENHQLVKAQARDRFLSLIKGLLENNSGAPDIVQFSLWTLNALISNGYIEQSYLTDLTSLLSESSEQEALIVNELSARSTRERNIVLLKDYLSTYKNISEDLKALIERIEEGIEG